MTSSRRAAHSRVVLACGLVIVAAASKTRQVCAQTDTTSAPSSKQAHWVTQQDAIAFGAALGATFALAPLDKPVSAELDERQWEDSRPLHLIAGDVAFFGGDGPFVASAALFGATEVVSSPVIHSFALHNLESIALATVITGTVKGIAGRALPGVKTPHAFELGRGFHDDNGPFVSFPSGHTAAAFAMAATIQGEFQHSDSSIARAATLFAFGGATAVAAARVVQRVHWVSDLPLAAVIGTWSGRAVQRHANACGTANAALQGLSIGLGPGGRTRIGWSLAALDEATR